MKRISPEEDHHAFILATARDLQQDKFQEAGAVAVLAPKYITSQALSCQRRNGEGRFKPGLNLFWEAAKQREDVGTSYETMYYSPVQRIFQIVSFKLNHESASKTKLTTKKLFEILSANLTVTSGEAVTQSFLQVLMALWNSLLSDTSFREEVLLSEELFGKRSPIKSIYVLRDLATACKKQPPCVKWVFDALMDAALNKTFKQGELNPQALAGKNPRLLALLLFS